MSPHFEVAEVHCFTIQQTTKNSGLHVSVNQTKSKQNKPTKTKQKKTELKQTQNKNKQ